MKLALVSLSHEGSRLASRLKGLWPSCELYLHSNITNVPAAKPFERILDLTAQIFSSFEGLVYFAPTGVVVRAIAPLVQHKKADPAIVVVDVGGRWAVSLLSGHEGGANRLALDVANALGAEPVISTTTEAAKNLIVGIGCRRGTGASSVVAAVTDALARCDARTDDVRLLASIDRKSDEAGLLEASRVLGVPVRFIDSEDVHHTTFAFQHNPLVAEKLDLPAVAEPAALLAGRRTRLLLPKQIYPGVTVAVAREDCMSLE